MKTNRSTLILFVILWVANLTSTAQTKYMVRGTIKDAASGEQIIGALVVMDQLKGIGVVTNEYGFYPLTIPEGDYSISVMMDTEP